jgi:flavin reductase (DIM6/NTAB) family NADH-FMN oxidoreductase RutF
MAYKEMTLQEKIEELNESFTNKSPNEEQIQKIESIRESYKKTGGAILKNCPNSHNLSIAITALEESLHRAIKSIILKK